MNELAKQIETYNHNLAVQVLPEILTALGQSIADLKTRNLEGTSIKVGDRFPAFSLPNADAKYNTLPIPAVFVVERDGTIIYKFADANYINRVDIEELIKVL